MCGSGQIGWALVGADGVGCGKGKSRCSGERGLSVMEVGRGRVDWDSGGWGVGGLAAVGEVRNNVVTSTRSPIKIAQLT